MHIFHSLQILLTGMFGYLELNFCEIFGRKNRNIGPSQGDQIGRIFAYWMIIWAVF
jgi:hypothetical protein